MQRPCVVLDSRVVHIELPPPDADVLPGVQWGRVDAFPTPAYWAYQAHARRIVGSPIRYRLGATLAEEVGACLLGGHGIPARIGLAAFEHVRERGAFIGAAPGEDKLREWLSEPMACDCRLVRYRFAAQKARYLAAALRELSFAGAPTSSGRALRDWLIELPGIGLKTASWVARNWLDADDVAILDIHILRAGVLGKFLDADLTVERHYLALERQFLDFSRALGVPASELDAVIWLEMMSARSTVENSLASLPDSRFKTRHTPLRSRSDKRQSHANQLTLIG